MKLENVAASVAIQRMWIYATGDTVSERKDFQADILAGRTVIYSAFDRDGNHIGQTKVEPENFPVTLVTETTF